MIASQLLLSMNDVLKLQIRDDYSIHKLIYSLFPNLRNGEPASSGILYADKGTHKGERNIIILSKLLPEKIPYGQLESKRIPDSFLEHKCYNFEICINPVKRKNASRKIVPLKNTEDILQWFMDKSPAWGFAVKAESLQLLANQVLAFEKKGQKVTIARAKISGTLHVTAQDLFKKSFELGIGRAKAFGCGFLQIIPVI